MRVLSTVAILLAAAAIPACDRGKSVTKAEWKEVTARGTKVSALFPGEPQEAPTDSGMQYVLEVMGGRAAYLLQVSDLGSKIDLDSEADVKRILDGARRAGVEALKGRLLSERDVRLGASPGRSYDAETADGLYRSRIYLTQTRSIHVVVIGPRKFCDGADARKFLGSLKIGE